MIAVEGCALIGNPHRLKDKNIPQKEYKKRNTHKERENQILPNPKPKTMHSDGSFLKNY